MYPVERIALWSAVIILFILYLWPGQSGYIGRKITFMEMREFDKVPEDIQKIYQENALRFADALGDAMSKTWSEVSDDNKKTHLLPSIDCFRTQSHHAIVPLMFHKEW